MQLAVAESEQPRKLRFRLPPGVPPFSTPTYRIFSLVWLLAFALAAIGPATGIYFRYTSPENNSQLMLGSRAGFGAAPTDATKVRFTVGPQDPETGLRKGDDIVAVPVSDALRVTTVIAWPPHSRSRALAGLVRAATRL